MLRSTDGLTRLRLHRVREEYIRGSLGVCNIRQKTLENRLRWLEHVDRTSDKYFTKRFRMA